MDNYFIRYEPYSQRYKKYRVVKVGEKENSILACIEYKKFKRKKARQLGVNERLVEGKYVDEYRKLKGEYKWT